MAGKQQVGGIEGSHRGSEEGHDRYQQEGLRDPTPPHHKEDEGCYGRESHVGKETLVVIASHSSHAAQLLGLYASRIVHVLNLEDCVIPDVGRYVYM